MSKITKDAPIKATASVGQYIIGSRLPTGIVLEHPFDPKIKVTLNGVNKSLIVGATYATTPVDASFWEHWRMTHENFPAFKSGAIFEAGSVEDAAATAAELVKEKTGFEKMAKVAAGVKPAGKD